jgi:hypothetical protein
VQHEQAVKGARRARVDKYLISERRWRSKHCFEGSAKKGLSNITNEFGGQSPCGGGNRASGSTGTGGAISVVLFFHYF